jgi:2-iminobutanoate/2-iminopropanoate deaminase
MAPISQRNSATSISTGARIDAGPRQERWMTWTAISSDRAWSADMGFPQAVRTGDLLHVVSVGFRPDGTIAGPDIESQMHQTIANIRALVEAAGGTMQSICKTVMFLADRDDFQAMNKVWLEHFGAHMPHRATLVCQMAAPALKIEMDCMAWLGA